MVAQKPSEPAQDVVEAAATPEPVEVVEAAAQPLVSVHNEALELMRSALRSGNDIETAAHYAGQSLAMVYRWLEVGKVEAERVAAGLQPDPAKQEYREFWEELRKARAEAIVRNVAYVQSAAKGGSWQAAAWWLERTVPETYARTKTAKQPDTDG